MIRLNLRTLAVACGLLAGAGSATAVDPGAQKLGRYTLADDTKLAVPSAADEDTEQIRHGGYGRGYGYGGYGRSYGYGGYGGGYRSYYGGWYRPYYGGFYGGYRPYYGLSFGLSYYPSSYYYTPSYYYNPSVVVYPSGYYYENYLGVSGTATSGTTQTLTARPTAGTLTIPQNWQPTPVRAGGESGNFRYDGGPSNPVPQPTTEPGKPIAQPVPKPKAESLKISVKPTPEAKPVNRYKAYGEK